MKRTLRGHLILGLVSVGLGLALLLVTSQRVALPGVVGSAHWGWPLPWRFVADLLVGGSSFFGVYLGFVNLGAFFIDLVFWTLVSFCIVELSWHLALPRVLRWAKMSRPQTAGHDSA